MLGRFEVVAVHRPIALVQPGSRLPLAPYAAVERDLPGSGPKTRSSAILSSGEDLLAATYDGRAVALEVTHAGRTTQHRSRRHGRARRPTELALTLTGPVVVAWVREAGTWVARALVDLAESAPALDVHDEAWLTRLTAEGDRSGTFGQLGLRDPRVVTRADGTPYPARAGDGAGDGDGDGTLFTATSAGPGGFRTGHTSVWWLAPDGQALQHRADLFVRRPDRTGAPRVFGDHATHLLRAAEDRDGDAGWLVATSTWGDFDRRRHPHVAASLAHSRSDLTHGHHVLDAAPLALPVDGLKSVGVWDPHLVRTTQGWLVAYVSATRFFAFHPVVATGPDLETLTLRSAARDRTATEGPTLLPGALLGREEPWLLAASDGRESRRDRRATYPVLDLGLDPTQLGSLDAAYPSNIPWPTLAPPGPGREDHVLLVGFDGTTAGGPLLGYGSHGALVVQGTSVRTTSGA